jgi:DNA-binding transcriptional regulator LsrR (DeoR family)
MPLSRIRAIPLRIGIASGRQKARSVIAAIRGGFINMLITNEDCARNMIESKV